MPISAWRDEREGRTGEMTVGPGPKFEVFEF